MALLITLLTNSVLAGIPSNAVRDAIKGAWEQATRRPWEDLYLDAFERAVAHLRPHLAQDARDGGITLAREEISCVLHCDLAIAVQEQPFSNLLDDAFMAQVARAMVVQGVLVIGGHILSNDDYMQLLHNLVQLATALFKESVLADELAFRCALLEQAAFNQTSVQEVQDYLAIHLEMVSLQLGSIERILASQDEQFQNL
jgi:hypothetical protein